MKALISLLLSISVLAAFSQKGKDGSVPDTGIINTVYTTLVEDAFVGETSIEVESIEGLSSGDLIMIIQMQGAIINSEYDSIIWGEIIDYNNSGNNEIVEIESVNGSAISFSTSYSLKYNYIVNGNTQIVRIPRYTTGTVSKTITAQPWNGKTGGIIAMEVEGDLVVTGSIDANGKGFRGGYSDPNGYNESHFDWYVSNKNFFGAEKGEGIAGYWSVYDTLSPVSGRYCRAAAANAGGGATTMNSGGGGGSNVGSGIWTGQGNPDKDTIYASKWENESIGFSEHTSSGGGRGGYSFSIGDKNPSLVPLGDSRWQGNDRRNVGGLGGRSLDTTGGKIFFGGGGGAGDQNNGSGGDGGNGGGIICLIVSGNVSGGGKIIAKGDNGGNCHTNIMDGAGGAGGGGAIIIDAKGLIQDIEINADGGNGGNQIWDESNNVPIVPAEAEGPGGAGGGGYIEISLNSSVSTSVKGGKAGITNRFFLGCEPASEPWFAGYAYYCFPVNGATDGGDGIISNTSLITNINNIKDSNEFLSINPNPNKGLFTVSFKAKETVELSVVDISGKKVYNKNISSDSELTSEEIDLQNLPAGIYYVKILSEDINQVKKVVIVE